MIQRKFILFILIISLLVQNQKAQPLDQQFKLPHFNWMQEFEFFGKVQSDLFKKEAVKRIKVLRLTGWIKDIDTTCVRGELIGKDRAIDTFKNWLTGATNPIASKTKTCKVCISNEIPEVLPKFFQILNKNNPIKNETKVWNNIDLEIDSIKIIKDKLEKGMHTFKSKMLSKNM